MTEEDKSFHESFKPSWGQGDKLVHVSMAKVDVDQDRPARTTSLMVGILDPIISESRDITFSGFAMSSDVCFLNKF